MHIGLNAHLLSGQSGYRSAGIHSYITGLLRHLHEVAPPDWTFTAFVGQGNEATFPGIETRPSKMSTESPLRRIYWEQAVQPSELKGIDLYHALAFVAPAMTRVPFVATVYDLSFVHYPERLPLSRRLYLRWFTALTCQRAKRVIAISQSTARDLSTVFGVDESKVDIALPGYDHDQFRPLPREHTEPFRAANDLPARFWLFVGTLEPRKNLVTLLEAYAALPITSRLPLVIAGGKGWDYEPIFDAVKKHELKEWVRFPGYIPSDKLRFWYNCAEVFIYPSVFEGFGLPVLEAMACGTPVITSEASSLPEVIGNTGPRVVPNDVAGWTEALRRAADDKAWRDQARLNGRERAKGFSWLETARSTVESYKKAVDLT